ncbi:MAG: hypothetical protein MSIBF_05300 [Candidatus Altiarchaeales archaeon IMC4]|nr:MAG: hypothetical protein MSIBF_05300 [Candidatus Altiarchaeales archaeon IMC4]
MERKLLLFILALALVQAVCADVLDSARTLTGRLLCLVMILAPGVAVLSLVAAGFLYMSSEERRSEGKKMFYNTLIGLILVFLFVGVSVEVVPDLRPHMGCIQDVIAGETANLMLCQIVLILQCIAAGLALLVIVYSGIQWIGSEGDPMAVNAAKTRIIYAVVGLIVVVIAGQFVKDISAGAGITSVGCIAGALMTLTAPAKEPLLKNTTNGRQRFCWPFWS